MSTDGSMRLFYVNLTLPEQEKLELIDDSVATLCLALMERRSTPIWIGDDDDGSRIVRLTASGQDKTVLFEIPAKDVIQLPPSAIYLLIDKTMRKS